MAKPTNLLKDPMVWSSQDFVGTLERLEKRAGEVSNVPESHPLGY